MRYSDDYRASAVIMLQAAGYPERRGALMEVANHLGVSHSLIRRWHQHSQNPPPSKMVQIKKDDIILLLKKQLVAAIRELPNALPDAPYFDIARSIGIIVDKLQLLEGEPTERLALELSDSDRSEQVTEILNAARAREARQSANGQDFVQ